MGKLVLDHYLNMQKILTLLCGKTKIFFRSVHRTRALRNEIFFETKKNFEYAIVILKFFGPKLQNYFLKF